MLHHGQLGLVHFAGGSGQRRRRGRNQQVTDGGTVADLAHELAHDAHVPGTADHAFVRHQVTGDDPEQGGLPRAVGADEGGLGAVRNLEGHPVEQLGAVGEEVVDAGNVNMGHAVHLPTRAEGRVSLRR